MSIPTEKLAGLRAEIAHFDQELLTMAANWLTSSAGQVPDADTRFERQVDVRELRESISSRRRQIAALEVKAALTTPGRTGGPHPVATVLADASAAVAAVVAATPAAFGTVTVRPCLKCGDLVLEGGRCPTCWHGCPTNHSVVL